MTEIDDVDTHEIVEPIPKRRPGRPAGSKNKKPVGTQVVTPEPEATPPQSSKNKRPRSPSSSTGSPTPSSKRRVRKPKRKSRTRVIVLSSSESEEAHPPPVRVVRKPRALTYSSSSEDDLPPPKTAPRVRPVLNLQTRQNSIDSRHATYSALFRHLS